MAGIKDKIAKSRELGLSDSEIWDRVKQSPEYKKSQEEGLDDAAVQQHLGLSVEAPQERSLGQEIGRKAAIAGESIARGAIAGTLGLPGDVSQLLQTGAKAILPESVSQYLVDKEGQGLPTSADIERAMSAGENALGITPPTPETTAEKYIGAAGKGLGAMAPFALSGGGGAVVKGLGLASGATGGLGSEAASQAFPESTAAPIVGGLIGAGIPLAGTLGVAGRQVAKNAVKDAETASDAVAESLAKSTERQSRFADDITKLTREGTEMALDHKNELAKAISDHEAAVVNANKTAETAISKATAEGQKTVDTYVGSLGGAKDLEAAGKVAQESATKWLDNLHTRVGDILNPIYASVPQDAKGTLNNLRSTLADINTEAGAVEAFNQTLKPTLPKRWQTLLSEAKEGEAITPSINDLKTLRSSLGKALTNPKIVNDVGDVNMRRMYGALSDDIRDTLEPFGLGPRWQQANAQASQLYSYAENTLGKLVKSESGQGNALPEEIANRIVSGGVKGGTLLAALRHENPEAADAIASHVLSSGKWGEMSAGAKAALVPDASERTALDAASAAKASATATANEARDAHIALSQAGLDETKRAQQAAVEANRRAKLAAQIGKDESDLMVKALKSQVPGRQVALEEAQAALENQRGLVKKGSLLNPSSQLGMIAGMAGAAAQSVMPSLLGHNALGAASAAGLLGASLPALKAAGSYAVRNPGIVKGLAGGALVGNAMAPK